MRQGGFKPKSHDSGVYWVRANAGSGNSSEDYKGEPSLKKFMIIILGCIFIVCALVA